MDLHGRVALVTGAARRVGRAIALRLAAAGCHVAVHYGRSRDEASEVVAACEALGARSAAFEADLADATGAGALATRVHEHFGRLDILVNNAAVFDPMTVDGFDLAAWERTLRVNLTAAMSLVHAAAPALRAARGRVVNISDAAVERPWPDHLAYIVSKGALDVLTRALARALAPEVNVVGVAPGVAEWPETYDTATRERLTRRIPLGRAGSAADVAAAVHYLLRDGDYVTGSILRVDGGRHVC